MAAVKVGNEPRLLFLHLSSGVETRPKFQKSSLSTKHACLPARTTVSRPSTQLHLLYLFPRSGDTRNAFNAGKLTSQVNQVSFEIIDRSYILYRASLVAQRVNNLPLMQETWVGSLGREDLLQKGMTTHPSILAGESHGQRSLVGYSPWRHKESDLTE